MRRAILRTVRTHPEGVSPKQIGIELGEPLSDTGYHCRVLRDCGAITLVRQQPVRGAIQNFYRFTASEPWVLHVLEEEGGSNADMPRSAPPEESTDDDAPDPTT